MELSDIKQTVHGLSNQMLHSVNTAKDYLREDKPLHAFEWLQKLESEIDQLRAFSLKMDK